MDKEEMEEMGSVVRPLDWLSDLAFRLVFLILRACYFVWSWFNPVPKSEAQRDASALVK